VRLLLYGLPGVGKTSLAPLLAREWGWPAFDSDKILEKETGMTPRQYFLEKGEACFRQLEKELLAWLPDACVVGIGGGALMHRPTLKTVQRGSLFVHLTCPLEPLFARLQARGLPAFLSAQDPWGSFVTLSKKRLPHYESLAMITVSTVGPLTSTLEQLRILAWLAIHLETSFGSPHGANPMVPPSVLW